LQPNANPPALTITTRLAMFPVKHPCAVLLFVQILGILIYPLMEDTSAERALFGVIGLLVLGAALYVVKRGPWLTGFAVMLALPVVVLSIWLAFDFDPRRMLIMAALEAMFYFYAAGSLIAYMLEDEFATIDELFAAGATFTLLAWAFAYVYVVCQALLPGSFGALAGPGNPRTWMELLFLSFTTLSGVGLGDIIPLLPMARALVMIEEFAGVMYLALVVSRLVALSAITRRAR
jgi:Ion channel